jgi:hypothetical protein
MKKKKLENEKQKMKNGNWIMENEKLKVNKE